LIDNQFIFFVRFYSMSQMMSQMRHLVARHCALHCFVDIHFCCCTVG